MCMCKRTHESPDLNRMSQGEPGQDGKGRSRVVRARVGVDGGGGGWVDPINRTL